jgi:N-glycosylase/DNA lyase
LPDDKNTHRIGKTIIEEVVACILGGYGMPSELGLLAFKRLRDYSLIESSASFKQINEALKEPFQMEDGSCKGYRFYNQKAYYIHSFIIRDDLDSIPCHLDVELRQWLLTVAGIGLKTASWITRNWLQSENVAILDIHILRAGKLAGFFKETENVSRNYFAMEESYLSFCKGLNVLPSNMDAVIWHYMKLTNKLALRALSYS